MKRILLTLATVALIGGGAFSQNNKPFSPKLAPSIEKPDNHKWQQKSQKSSSSAVLWTEDFGQGLSGSPNGAWTTSGQDAPWVMADNDGPDNLLQFGWGPLPSPTAGNGFAIFDFYGRFQDPNGFATSPAEGQLTSPVIDLSGNQYVEIEFFQQLYWCCENDWDAYLEISTDGGNTFPNQIKVNPWSANARHWNLGYGYEFSFDISDEISADPSNVVIRFNWSSLNADQNGQYTNAYFWMIDDITIQNLPRHAFKFVDYESGGVTAPARDVIFPSRHPRYGNPQVDQASQFPISFDANILNYGYEDQTDVLLKVDIYDASNNSVVTTLTSPVLDTLAYGDTGTYNDFATSGTWTPPATVGEYYAVYSVESDSIPSSGITPIDTIPFNINANSHGGHFGTISNVVGTAQGLTSVAQAFTFPQAVDTNDYVVIEGISAYISSTSDTTGNLIVEVYDTTGFSYGPSGGPVGNPYVIQNYSLNANNVGQTSFIRFDDLLVLPTNGGYMVVINFVPNAADGDIALGNDQTVSQPTAPTPLRGMLFEDGQWYPGFTSGSFTNLIVNMRILNSPFPFSIDELLKSQNAIKVYPNPTSSGIVTSDISIRGTYDLEVMTLNGQKVFSDQITVDDGDEKIEHDFSKLPKGTYLLNYSSEEANTTKKLIIE